MNATKSANTSRLILAALILILGAYWAGARFAPRQPRKVEAVPLGGSHAGLARKVAARDPPLTPDEGLNLRISPPASPPAAHPITQTTDIRFFLGPRPA